MAIVSAIPSVTHTKVVMSSAWTEVVTTSVVVTASTYSVPSVSTSVSCIEVRTSKVEVVTMRIACIDAEVPVACIPVKRTVEISSVDKRIPLCFQQDIAHVEVTTLPIGSIYIVIAVDTHQVVEVNLVGCLILLIRQVQLVSHLVRQEECLVTCLFVTHGMGRNRHGQYCYQGHHYLFHNRMVFNCSTFIFFFLVQKYEENRVNKRDFP